MKRFLFNALLFSLCSLGCTSCIRSEEPPSEDDLLNPAYKVFEVCCGTKLKVPVRAYEWIIEQVREQPSNEVVLDKNNRPLSLDGNGTVEAANGWLTLTRNNRDGFIINLKENFDQANDRKLSICISGEGNRGYVEVTQKAGEAYEVEERRFTEIEALREIYFSDKECNELILTNPTSKFIWGSTGSIFKDVTESSTFESNDFEAFAWTPEEGFVMSMPDLIMKDTIDDKIVDTNRWTGTCPYKKGTMKKKTFIDSGGSIALKPHSSVRLTGMVEYCKRVCNYTLIVRNRSGSTPFEINGTWTQVVILSTSTTIY